MNDDAERAVPRWNGIAEPMTVSTDVALAALAMALAARLGYAAAANGRSAGVWIASGLLATAMAAIFGAVAHGLDPRAEPVLRDRFWRATLYAIGATNGAIIASVAFFAARASARTALLGIALVKFVVYLVAAARRPRFSTAGIDTAASLALLLGGAIAGVADRRLPGGMWLVTGVLVSAFAGFVQARRLTIHRHFNHNDLFHVIEMIALVLFYRGGRLLVDR